MKLRQKIDKAASDQLERILGTFPAAWGRKSDRTPDGKFRFDGFSDRCDVHVAYDAKKQLLGGVYSLVFSFKSTEIRWDGEGKAELRYKGRMLKGDAYFKPGKTGDALSVLLNSQKKLIRLLSELDLLNASVSVTGGAIDVSLSPLGGAYTYTVFPPMKYGALLPDKDIERIRKVLVIFAGLFSHADMQAAAGAEL